MELLEEMEYVGDVPEGWKWVKLGEIVFINSKNLTPNYPYDEIYYLDTGSVAEGRLISSYKKFYLKEAPSRAKRIVNDGDIVYSLVRPIQRHYGIIKNPPDNLIVSTGFAVITADNNKAENRFIYYYLTLDEIVDYLDSIAEGSTTTYPSIVPDDLKNLIIPLPPLPEQKAIAEVLSSFDDKIELLHRQNKTLEEMAMTLFRQWFIEPTKDGLPEGWEEKKLKDVYIFEKGIEPGSKNYLETPSVDTIRFIRVGDMLDNKANVYIQKDLVGNSICKFDDLLVSFDGTVGRVSFGIQGCYSSGIKKIYSEDEIYNKLWLKHQIFISEEIQDEINMYAEGTTILHASSSIDYLSFVLPPKEKIEEYDKFFDPIYKKILHNKTQIQTLEKLRDTLLPKLMSGEAKIMNNEQ
jgi:type I restriction enzyme S subunit